MPKLFDQILAATDRGIVIAGANIDSRKKQIESFQLDANLDLAGTLDVVIEESWDDATSWQTYVSFTSLTASGKEVKAPDRQPGPLIRARTSTLSGQWDIVVRMMWRPI